MRQTHERELKLRPGPQFELPEGNGALSRSFTSMYYDTDDGRLAAVGVTLRRRLENGKNLWQLKLPAGAGRRELEMAGGPGAVPRAFRELLAGLRRDHKLEPVATLRTRRRSVRVAENGAVAEIALDAVAVLEGRRVRESFEELEVELLSGDEKALRRIGKGLRRLGAEKGDGRPKLLRALDVSRGEATPPADAPAIAHLGALLAHQGEEMLRHDPGTRLGSDPEDLHRLRVATRRSRALLRAARPLLERKWAEELRGELSWLGSALGPVRDLDVLLEHLYAEIADLANDEEFAARRLAQALESERSEARAEMLEALRASATCPCSTRWRRLRALRERAAWRRAWPRLRRASSVACARRFAGFRRRPRTRSSMPCASRRSGPGTPRSWPRRPSG